MENKLIQQLESIMADEQNVETTINAAAGVIARIGDNNRQNVLIIKRSKDDHWPMFYEFPRGKCDKPPGENLIHCLKREIKEETGLDVIPIEKIDTIEYLADKGTRKTICHNYLCMLKNPDQEIKLSKEHDSYKWVSEVGEIELMVMPEQKKTLEKILNSERSIVSYPHDDQAPQQVEEYIDQLEEGGALIGTYFGAMLSKMAFDFYQQNYSKFARACKDLPPNEKTICMLNAKAKAKQAEVGKLKSAVSNCGKAKNPEKCKTTLMNKINQASAVARLTMNRVKQLSKTKAS